MIDKVGYTRPTTPAARAAAAKKAGSVSGAKFAEALAAAEGVAASDGVESVQAASAVGVSSVLLGAQEISEEEIRRKKAIKKGRFTLDALEGLRDALLMGALPISTLRNLEKIIAEERETTQNPALNAILDEIELRAAVELAKLEMSGIVLRS